MLMRLMALKCKISRGGFSDERVFRLVGAEGYEGISSRRHLWSEDGLAIEEGEPPIGQELEGLVATRVLGISGDAVSVSVPDGEVIVVPVSALVKRPQGVTEHVPV